MSSENTINGITWIDLTNPTKQDIEEVLSRYSLSIPSETILDFEMLPQLQTQSAVHYCVMRFPRLYQDKLNKHRTSFEIDCIISENLLITIHDIPLFEIHTIRAHTDKGPSPLSKPTSSLSLFGIIITEFYSTVRRQTHVITDQLEQIELEIFQSFDKSTVEKISKVSRHLIDIERSINASTSVIKQIAHLNEDIQSKNIQLATDLFSEIRSLIDTNRVILDELRKTHQNMIAFNTTFAVRTLSIITFLTLPISVLVDSLRIYSDHSVTTIREPLLLGVGLMTVLMIMYFRKKKWL